MKTSQVARNPASQPNWRSTAGLGFPFSRVPLDQFSTVDGRNSRFERTKTLHDVRGTFCTTQLTEWQLTDDDAAEIMGWSLAGLKSTPRLAQRPA